MSKVKMVEERYPSRIFFTYNVDAAEVKHGHWYIGEGTHYYCSVCHKRGTFITPYCPWCGSKMEGIDE